MAALLRQESSRMYSWWWDSHISPKNSKWLQENLTDMDAKVKTMIKLIEEDADSFARRAEMYYKKRPELMKLVEEFYRAYRALAERYDHATGELRHAHRTISEAFPNQVPYAVLPDDSTQGSSGLKGEPHTPEMRHPIRALLDQDDLHKNGLGLSSTTLNMLKRNCGFSEESESGISKRGLKQLTSGGVTPQNSKVTEGRIRKGMTVQEPDDEAECEVETLKRTLAGIEAEKEAILLQYLQSLLKFSSPKGELNNAQQDAGALDERASKADIEVKVFKEALLRLEAERDAGLLQYNHCLERISTLEKMIAQAHEDSKGLNERASKAEIEAQNLKQELSRLETEKEAGLLQYRQCLEMIHALESKISLAEKNAKTLDEQTERAETEVKALMQALTRLNEEKKAIAFQYEQCLEKLAQMEREIFNAHEDAKRLNSEILMGAEKLRTAEQQRVLLERSNQFLQVEAESLVQKIAMKDQELLQKQKELEKLQASQLDEHLRFVEVEVTLQTLQKLHSQSQEEQKALTLELQNKLQTLKNLEVCNHDLEEDIKQVKRENQNLIELNNSSTISTGNLQNEVLNLKKMKEKLEKEIAIQEDKSNTLQLEVQRLKEEIKGLSRRYQALVEQVLSVGLNPEHLESSVKELKEENSKLKEVCNKQGDEKEVLQEKLKDRDNLLRENAGLESSLSGMNIKLEWSGERVKDLQESCQFLQEEKSSIVAEKATLLSQLQIMNENMQKLLEKNFTLEISLAGADVELEGLRAKSKLLEDFCQLQKNEKSNLQNERSTLVSQLENVERRLGNLEKMFAKLEEKYADMEKGKELTLGQVEELRDSLNTEQQERAYYVRSSESRMADLERLVHILKEETRSRKKEFEEELDKAVKAQVEIFILQKFIIGLEEKNLSLMIDCQKHVDTLKLSNKLIAELESENLEQQAETEFLLDELEKLRIEIYQVFRVLQFDSVNMNKDKIEQGQIPMPRILEDIDDFKNSVFRSEDEKQQLLIQNSVLLALIRQLGLEGAEQESEKKNFEQELMITMEQCLMLQKDKNKLLEMNKQLMLEVSEGKEREDALKDELDTKGLKLVSLQEAYLTLQEENSRMFEEGRLSLKRFFALKEEMSALEEENTVILREALDIGNVSTVFKSFGIEKAKELNALAEDLNCVHGLNGELKEKVELLGKKLEKKEAEGQLLNETVVKLHKELEEIKDINDHLNIQIFIDQDSLGQKATEVLEAEQKLKAMHTLNADLCITVEDLKKECKELKCIKQNAEKKILEISRDCAEQEKDLQCLQEINKSLESEVGILCDEIEEHRIREVNLSSELQERSYEFELWEAEASSFYFDLQISSTREVLLENKVHELTEVFESLEDESATNCLETKQMKERVGFLESEIGQLKSQLSSYDPVIASLRDNITSLKYNVLRLKKHRLACNDEQKSSEMGNQLHHFDSQEPEVKSIAVTDGISELQEIQSRIKAIEKALVEEIERHAVQDGMTSSIEVEDQITETEYLKLKSTSGEDIQREEIELEYKFTEKSEPEASEVRNRTLMEDIPLYEVSDSSFYKNYWGENAGPKNQMLGCGECGEQECGLDLLVNDRQKQAGTPAGNISVLCRSKAEKSKHPSSALEVEKELSVDKLEVSRSNRDTNKKGNQRKILERLASDAQKLTSLQTTLQDLKRKMVMNKRSKKANDPEYEIVKQQLEEVEETVVELVGINDQLTKDTKESPSSFDRKPSAELEDAGRNEVTEQAQKGSEKIGRLQLEVQIIHYILLKLEEENNKTKGKYKFSESKTGALLRDFVYSSGRSSGGRRNKGCLCPCVRQPTNGD